ncbi:membrane protein [Streptomyces phage Saftant]|uniref:Membrane protein n=1 Tax=Streptomyces phage Saftant TaxID=2601693 RepID=A0A5J6D855_9CAUD|nr:membrane protein [Streptomyces phage Saftant]QEQ94058.1 membrane protein [Streptomyces phage Saftant]
MSMEPTVQVALVTTGGTVFVTLIGVVVEMLRRNHKALAEVQENVSVARDQVANSHTTNLRDDMDRLHDDVREVLDVLRQHGKEIGGLREDLRQERIERLAVSDRLDHHLTVTVNQ